MGGNHATATVSFPVTPVNDPPIANPQSVVAQINGSVAINLTASDVDGDALTYTIASQPTNGKLTGTAPNVVYTPKKNFYGSDSFTFTANDGHGGQSTATVSIFVNRPPKAVNDNITTKLGIPYVVFN